MILYFAVGLLVSSISSVQCFLPLPQSSSVVVFNERSNISREQEKALGLDYTSKILTYTSPLKPPQPAQFAFDDSSVLRANFGGKVKPVGVEMYMEHFDFTKIPDDDILTAVYEKELEREKMTGSIRGKWKDPMLADKENLMFMMNTAFTLPRNSERDGKTSDSVGLYIMNKLGKIGLLTGTQSFYPSQLKDLYWPDGNIPPGNNIIGVFPGQHYGTKQDKVVVIGAHWDTTETTDGFDDNGSGVAAMLEAARALAHSQCKLKYTVFFVAFDKEEVGCQGSHEFVRGFLLDRYFKESGWPEFQGAFIMDSLLNYNTTQGSQIFPENWKDVLPETWSQIQSEGTKGDFLSVIYRKEGEGQLANLFTKHYKKLYQDHSYRKILKQDANSFKVKTMGIDLPSEPVDDLSIFGDFYQFLRSDHIRFWYSYEETYRSSLRALLLTDTGPFRGVMSKCYHNYCDSMRNGNDAKFANYDFLVQTTQAVIDTVADMAGATCKASKRARKLERYATKVDHDEEDDFYNHPIGSAENAIDVDDYEGPISAGERRAPPLASLANTAIYLAYTYKWAPSLFVWG